MSPAPSHPRAVVLLSGGLDSATCLAIARADGCECHALTIAYGQRHAVELAAAARIAASLSAASHKTIQIDLRAFGGSALTDDRYEVPKQASPDPTATNPTGTISGTNPERQRGAGPPATPSPPLTSACAAHAAYPSPPRASPIPITYVPARNTIFLAYALGYAEVLDAERIYVGVNAVDYSGYPDCRPEFIQAFQKMADVATRVGVEGPAGGPSIIAPLIALKKADIIRRGLALGVDYGLTHSCYDPGPRGEPCARCDSCRIRIAAFSELGMADPALPLG